MFFFGRKKKRGVFFQKKLLSYLLYIYFIYTLGGRKNQYYQGFARRYMTKKYVIHDKKVRDT